HDLSPDRLKLVEENCARLGVTSVQNILSTADASGAVRTPPPTLRGLAGRDRQAQPGLPTAPTHYDRILLDPPCSNPGVLRRRVDLRWRITPNEISRLRAIQLELLNHAAFLLKPGGTLVYSTCSLEPEENQQLTREFLSAHPNFNLDFERELLPFADGVDGAYAARLSS